jgi:histidyl-tRNA synthetase
MRPVNNDIVDTPFKYKNPEGLSDVLPESQRYWQYSENLLNRLSGDFGYHHLITPPLEAKSLYTTGFGKESADYLIDSNIDDRGEKYVFRAHPKVSVIRSFIDNGFTAWPPPVHLSSRTSTIKRHDTNLRQNFYYSFDILGAKDAITDTTLLILLQRLARDLKLKNYVIVIHSLGCSNCRPNFEQIFSDYCKTILKNLCSACQSKPNYSTITNCVADRTSDVIIEAPSLLDNLCPECKKQITGVLETCDSLGVQYELDSSLTTSHIEAEQTIFSLKIGDQFIDAITGYHYDSLASRIAETPISAIGITIDLQILSSNLEIQHISVPPEGGLQVFIAQLGSLAKEKCVPLLQQLYKAGYTAATASESESITSQLKVAERLRSRITLIIGQKEAVNGHIIVRDMISGVQDDIYLDELMPALAERLEAK